mgnify:CR=1 FL=1
MQQGQRLPSAQKRVWLWDGSVWLGLVEEEAMRQVEALAGKRGCCKVVRGLAGTTVGHEGLGAAFKGLGGPESSNSESLSCLPGEFCGSRAAASEQSHQQILGARDAVSLLLSGMLQF